MPSLSEPRMLSSVLGAAGICAGISLRTHYVPQAPGSVSVVNTLFSYHGFGTVLILLGLWLLPSLWVPARVMGLGHVVSASVYLTLCLCIVGYAVINGEGWYTAAFTFGLATTHLHLWARTLSPPVAVT